MKCLNCGAVLVEDQKWICSNECGEALRKSLEVAKDYGGLENTEVACDKCCGHGVYCWTCGEIEAACHCDDGDGLLGQCDKCDGSGVTG
jgi:hypothetical protein